MSVFKEACIISHENWIRDIENEINANNIDIPNIKIPDIKKDNLIKIYDTKNKKKKVFNKTKIIKIILVAAVLFAALLSVYAFSPFKDFVVEFFEDYNLFSSNILETRNTKDIKITNLPEGFVLVEESVNNLVILQKYKYNEKSFIITKNTPNSEHCISNTYPEEHIFYNNDIKYSLFQLTEETTEVVWLTDRYAYILVGHGLKNEEMIEIAKNIE